MANAVIGALRVNLGIDSAQFQNGLKQAQTSTSKFGAVMKTALVAAAAAGAAALGGLAVAIKSNLNSIDDLSKAASKIGIPIEELSKLRYAADLSGVSMGGLQTAVGRMSRNMADAAQGTGEGAKAFAQLGISVKGADGKLKSSTGILSELSDRFAKMPDGAQKTALAMQLMGRSGADMIPLLNGGSAALNDLLNEAKAFGLEISAGTGKAAEQFNDNLSRIGYAVQGVGLSLTAALAPALVVVSEAMVRMAQAFVDALQYLPTIAEYASVAGGALLIAFSPAIMSAMASGFVALGAAGVAAIRAITVAIAANPLGALAVGIAAAVTAVYYFRDEIQKAVGVDVVQIAKGAANLVIGSFVAAYEDIKFIWSEFPNVIGAAAVGAANAMISGIESMLNAASGMLNSFIGSVNSALAMIPGADLQIGTLGSVSMGRVENPFADALGGALDKRNTAVSAALNFDYIGAIGTAFKGATPAAQDFAGALGDANSQLEDMAGGGGGGGGGGGKGKKGKLASVKDGLKSAADEMNQFVETIAGAMSSAFQGLIDGSKSVKEVLSDLLKQLSTMLMNSAFKALVGGLLGGGTGGGGFLSNIFGSLFGFRNGGSFNVGGSGGIDSQLVAFKASPKEHVSVTKPGQERHGGAVAVHVTASDLFHVMVQREADGRIQSASPRIVGAAVNQANANVVPTMGKYQRDRAGGDYRG